MKEKVDIIIKALNEEKHIQKCIESALEALKNYNGNVILVDSLSEDKTVEIAKKYPIKIIQLGSIKQRSCGAGPQIGYKYSTSDFIYILDGDMEINKNFIPNALKYFQDPQIGAIGGTVSVPISNFISIDRNQIHTKWETGEISHLPEGGLYRKKTLDTIGHFSNPYLYANEEADIGYKITAAGYKIIRISEPMIVHHMHQGNSFFIILKRLTSKYARGPGQVLRYSLNNPKIFMMHLKRLRNEIIFLLFQICTVFIIPMSIFISKYIIISWSFLSIIFLFAYIIRKKFNIKEVFLRLNCLFVYSISIPIGFFISNTKKNSDTFPYETLKVIKK